MRRNLVHHAIIHQDLARVRLQQAGYCAQGGGLAAPAGTKQAQQLARLDAQIKRMHRDHAAIALVQRAQLDRHTAARAHHAPMDVSRPIP